MTGTVSDVNYQDSATASLVVAKASQVITFPPSRSQVMTSRVVLAATASSEPGGVVRCGRWVGRISGGTNLTFSAAGLVSVVASTRATCCTAPNSTSGRTNPARARSSQRWADTDGGYLLLDCTLAPPSSCRIKKRKKLYTKFRAWDILVCSEYEHDS